MNPDELLDALGEIDPALLSGAEQARKRRKQPLLLPLAACLALAVTRAGPGRRRPPVYRAPGRRADHRHIPEYHRPRRDPAAGP